MAMTEPSVDFHVGDRVRYREGTQSWAARKGKVATITAIFSDGTSGPRRADVLFDDGLERGASLALLEHAQS